MYLQHSKGVIVPLPTMTSIETLPPGIYEFRDVEIAGGKSKGLMDIEESLAMEPIIRLRNDAYLTVIDYINSFEQSEAKYREMEFAYKTGVLLYGQEGTGKTMLARNVAYTLKDKGYIIIFLRGIGDLGIVPPMFRWIRHAQPTQKFCVIMDEFESYIRASEQDVLRFLDGAESQDGCVSIAITNHHNTLSPRLLRQSRFGLIRRVPVLDIEVIQQYIKAKLENILNPAQLYEFINRFDDGNTYTIDQVKDAIVKKFILGEQFTHSDFDIEENRKKI